jgi:phosphoribosylformylglycinamidine cyclo-ligase
MRPGDVVLALPSSGLHSNGYSLVRKVLLDHKGYRVDTKVAELGKTLGEELLIPTTIYVQPLLDLLDIVTVSGIAHITGGGFRGNIPRVLPESCAVTIDKASWKSPPVFDLIQREAGLDDDEMFRTFNMGVGLVVILPAGQTDEALKLLRNHGVDAWIIGEVKERIADGEAVIFG